MRKKSEHSLARMRRLDPLVRRMYRDYRRGLTLQEVAAKYCPESKHGCARIFHLFKIRGLKRRAPKESIDYAANGLKNRAKLDALVARMYADYQRGDSLGEVGRRYGGRSYSCVAELFRVRGLAVRKNTTRNRCTFDKKTGCFIALPSLSVKELDAIIARQTRVCRPTEMRYQWERWSLAERGWFIARMRRKLNLPGERPTTPFSANVEPFDYATPRAHEIAATMNLAGTSRTAVVKLRAGSQGVIWNNELWFWARKVGYQKDLWTPGHGRPALHKTIWEQANGRRLRLGEVIRFADRNPNNLDPANLVLATRGDLAFENRANHLAAKSRAITALLLDRANKKGKRHAHTDTVSHIKSR